MPPIPARWPWQPLTAHPTTRGQENALSPCPWTPIQPYEPGTLSPHPWETALPRPGPLASPRAPATTTLYPTPWGPSPMALVPLNPHLHSLTSHPTLRRHSIPHAPWTPTHLSSSGTPCHHSEDTAPLLRYPLTPYPISLPRRSTAPPAPTQSPSPRAHQAGCHC